MPSRRHEGRASGCRPASRASSGKDALLRSTRLVGEDRFHGRPLDPRRISSASQVQRAVHEGRDSAADDKGLIGNPFRRIHQRPPPPSLAGTGKDTDIRNILWLGSSYRTRIAAVSCSMSAAPVSIALVCEAFFSPRSASSLSSSGVDHPAFGLVVAGEPRR